MTGERLKVVVYTEEVVGQRMAGPGIRSLRFAEALSVVAEVRLISAVRADLERDEFEIIRADGDALLTQIEWADMLVFGAPLLTLIPELRRTDKYIVVDLYDPVLLEQLQRSVFLGTDEDLSFTIRGINDLVQFADFAICASEKQRDLLIGQLIAMGRINPATYRDDPSLRRLIDVVAFGVDETPPRQATHAIKGTVDGIGVDDTVLLWGGGISDWFDPLTLIEAVGRLSTSRPDLRLFFLAVQHANPVIGTMRIADDAKSLAERLGLLGSHVFFNEHWVPHEHRADWFLDADIGVSTHLDHLETAYSFRTRILDYLWAGLPIISTSGDVFEPMIRERGVGVVVPPGDVDALADAIDRFLGDPDARARAVEATRELAAELSWANALVPLVEFAAHPRYAADRPRSTVAAHSGTVGELVSELDAMRASSSWRITAPLRALSASIGRLRRR
jgi:glycosyltransferase involved in cell wall biosynthesis